MNEYPNAIADTMSQLAARDENVSSIGQVSSRMPINMEALL